ncbi:MAG: GNAT family N-acetyltransferase [Ginsengibacter sp.]
MNHILDNPVWNALISGNQSLSQGTETVKYFSETVSPFVGFKEFTADNFNILHDQIKDERSLAIMSAGEVVIPASWQMVENLNVWQLVYRGTSVKPYMKNRAVVPLLDENIDEMVQLTGATHPGPFEKGTIRFGYYEGIFEGGKLAAMAGQRLHPNQYAEISAVCTHPDFTGRGLASALLLSQIQRIQSASEIPFLHVLSDNERAIKLYQKMGFVKRSEIFIYIIKKKNSELLND